MQFGTFSCRDGFTASLFFLYAHGLTCITHWFSIYIFHTMNMEITDGTNNEETLAKSLLLEENETRTDDAIQSEEKEQQQQCIKRDKTMKRIESDICIVCDNQCHIHCMEYINGEPMCLFIICTICNLFEVCSTHCTLHFLCH
jgi:hypothetical protein